MKYKSIIYNEKESKRPLKSFFNYARDCFIYYLPIKALPPFIRKLLYGDISYVFFIHPRRSEDFYLGLPFLSLLRRFISKKSFISLVSRMPPVIVSNINNKKANGIVMSSLILPEILLKDRKKSIISAIKAIKFANKITRKPCFVGLGAWWPIISKRGIELKARIRNNNIIITNGHTGTLLSIYEMLAKISSISNVNMSKLKICVIGAGKMGANITRILYGKVNTISLLDIHKKNTDFIVNSFKNKNNAANTIINSYTIDKDSILFDIFNKHHIAICVTSNLNVIIKNGDIPDHFIIIDDSRPEAISRNISNNNIVILEGGLMKIGNSKTNYDYGFGIDDNVFGCLAETYALAIDESNTISPTLGDVDIKQFELAKVFYKMNNISIGDFKTGDKIITPNQISDIINYRDNVLNNRSIVSA